ncbi:MAG: hypothetical protein IJZ91_00790 [Oscillospiraceae bacterium]|nr:hypothetical protein [Oscillospiraceae bacterium]
MDTINSAMYIDNAGLKEYAAASARLLHPEGECTGAAAAGRLRQDYREIRRCHEEAQKRYGELSSPPSEWEWILDNWYMVQREYQAVIRTLDSARHLRRCRDGLMVSALCRTMLLSGRGKLTEERLRLYMEGFESVTVLKMAELEALPAALSAAVIGAIAEVCRGMRRPVPNFQPQRALEELFTSLRLFSVLDMEKLIADVNVTNSILSTELTGDYPRMDSGTRQAYLKRVERLARKAGAEEHIYAKNLVKKAREQGCHVGFFLFEQQSDFAESCYIGANVLLSFFISFLTAYLGGSVFPALLLLLPVSELVKSFLDFVLLHIVPARRLFRMDMRQGVPPEGRSICVISSLLGAEADSARLEELYHASKDEGTQLLFGLLADLPAASSSSTKEDAALLLEASNTIDRLNRKYGQRFYLFTRSRSFDGERYTAHERKRGALMELARLLCDKPNQLKVTGERDALSGVKYIITLDSDSRIYPGSLGELIGAMLHPLNRPQIDERCKVVKKGHALIHPRIDTELKSAVETDFAIIFSGGGGSDPYGSLCGELYMDAFGSGGFAGKGIIDAQALLKCTSHFPQGRVLSHDAPEGAYLRGAYMGDVEFSDRFPSKPLSYYKRQHRWIRGDWQNLPFIFAPGLRYIDRWRLFDSLRRSLIAPATLAAILTGFYPGGAVKAAAWAALLALLSRLFISLAESLLQTRNKPHLRRYTRILSGVGGAIVQTFIRLWLLPYEAWISVSAICAALWRMFVSHKKLLQWQTAAQTDCGAGLGVHIKAMLIPLLLGAALVISCPLVIGKASGLMWLLSPAAAAALALDARKETVLSRAERDYLQNAAKQAYKYLDSFHHAQNNFLPPDNFQEQPPVGLAKRTSPTNIGLALCSAAAALDMGFISREKLEKTIGETISTLERMPKAEGHLYNWYDIESLKPLQPAYVSTVDSGNLCAGLITARAALEELGNTKLAQRLQKLIDDMDFAPLFDKRRELFHICYDPAAKRGVGGWYDLMASEAMLTSYLACARGDVPVRHWRRLSRAQLQKDGYRGLASWTGTMFEYLMPVLFLPVYRGSLLYESQRFCVYAQKKRVWAGKPWGISESAFYSLDSALNYRYKAHGVAALALKRGQDADMVVSPYSSFLALAIDPAGSVKNLKRLEDFGATGRFGFIEALDFSPGRCRSDRGEQVRCYMAHHVGMSIVSAANALCSGSIQRKFMSDPAMNAFSLLLQERLENGGVVIRRNCADIPERIERSAVQRWLLRGNQADRELKCAVLSNGAYNLLFSNTGHSRAFCGQTGIYEGSPQGEAAGLDISLSLPEGTFSLLNGEPADIWELGEDHCSLVRRFDQLECSCGASVAYGDCGELRTVELTAEKDMSVALSLSFHPVLAKLNDYVNHKAFWELGIQAQTEGDALILRRIRRDNSGELWLCLVCSQPARFDADRKGGCGSLSQPLVQCSAELELKAGESREIRFAMGFSTQREEAVKSARRILASSSYERGNMTGAAALHLKMGSSEVAAAMDMLTRLWSNELCEAEAQSALWQYGISGDYPIICCDGRAVESESVLKSFCLLKSCGVDAELVFLSDEQGEYRQPVFGKISDCLEKLGLGSLIGAEAGVHFVPMQAAALIISRSAWTVGAKREKLKAPPMPPAGNERVYPSLPDHSWTQHGFCFEVKGNLPSRVWQQPITNGRFGFMATDCGIGGMWYENAREMPINLPAADSTAISGSEFLWLERAGEKISLFAANDGYSCRVEYAPGKAVWEKTVDDRQIRLTAFVPEDSDARVLVIEGAVGMKLGWTLLPTLGADASSVRITKEGRALFAQNPMSYFENLVFTALCSRVCSTETGFYPPAMHISVICDEITAIACGVCPMDRLEELCTPNTVYEKLRRTEENWLSLIRRVQLESGIKALDNYMNTWAAYQTVACRLMARTSLYQRGGAIGFRDQLQDGVNMLLVSPEFAKERILDACRHQYAEGDVMHWWHAHPKGDRGVRTHCSDDLLWLVWALCEYTEKTGDYSICDIPLPFMLSLPLEKNQKDRYETPESGTDTAAVTEHARAALEMCISRGFGSHGLPRMGSGDWNDALSCVDGESVWLGWFMAHCAKRFAALLKKLGDKGAKRYENLARRLAADTDKAWAGRWYCRAYFADGEALGGAERIDSVAQSWAVLSDTVETGNRPQVALDSALRSLVDRKHKIVRLFDPPYTADERYAGYIAGYGEGFRENGGQYSHGAIWLAMAAFRLGRHEDAWEILSMLLPQNHDLNRYAAEPFVLAADVYSAKGREGEAGWTWYTGSAGWYFRAVYEEMLGLKLKEGRLSVSPRLPAAFEKCTVHWTDGAGVSHEIAIDRQNVKVDGKNYKGEPIG